MNDRMAASLDRYITGNYGADYEGDAGHGPCPVCGAPLDDYGVCPACLRDLRNDEGV